MRVSRHWHRAPVLLGPLVELGDDGRLAGDGIGHAEGGEEGVQILLGLTVVGLLQGRLGRLARPGQRGAEDEEAER